MYNLFQDRVKILHLYLEWLFKTFVCSLETFCRNALITCTVCLWPQGYSAKKGRVHYSGPLVPQGGNIEEMLKEHERQIQRAMRKACLEKNNNESGQSQSLLYHQRINGQ